MASVGEDETRIDRHMTRAPLCVTPATSVGEAVEAMGRKGVRHIPVVDVDGAPVGLLTEHALHETGLPADAPVAVVMNASPLVVPPDASVVDVVRSMLERGARCALVADRGSLAGIFTMSDAVAAILRLHVGQHAGRMRASTCDRWGHVIAPR